MITMDDIVREGHPALRKTAKEVTLPPEKGDIELLNNMMTFLQNSQDEKLAEQYKLRPGVGLAAPQLGINKRLIAIHFKDHNDKLYSYKLINPRVRSHSVEQAYLASGEGCLSVDRAIDGFVVRNARVTIQAFDTEGNVIKLRLKGYPAIVFQHEIDHLNGIMFFDHINEENPYFVPENTTAIE